MKRIALLSDTHSFLDEKILKYVHKADEVWHAGDFGNIEVSDILSKTKPLKGVYGNIDGHQIRAIHPLHQKFSCEGLNIWMTHIGGYPGHYAPQVKDEIKISKPDLFISGHSHILKVMPDKTIPGLLHINPGAAGIHGFHHIRTMVMFSIENKTIKDVDVIELGPRGSLDNLNILQSQ
ncbi:MAG: metallophosphoesterase family protein [Bacteroidetes bacterium]|nr:metallophosphoesterase family protein [Bacteroidota bacterium]